MANRPRTVIRIIVNLLALIAFIINAASRILVQAGIAVEQSTRIFSICEPNFDDAGPYSHIAPLAMVQEIAEDVKELMLCRDTRTKSEAGFI